MKKKLIFTILITLITISLIIGIIIFFFINSPLNPNIISITCGDSICHKTENCPQDCINSSYFCGNLKCDQFEDMNNCPQDCLFEIIGRATCGDSICDNNYENKFNCASDCGILPGILPNGSQKSICLDFRIPSYLEQCIDNSYAIKQLNGKQRPLVGGMRILNNVGGLCTLGGIIGVGNKFYGLTAGHCLDPNMNDKIETNEVGLPIYDGDFNEIGHSVGAEVDGILSDFGLVILDDNIDKSLNSYIGSTIYREGEGLPKIGMDVYKVGATTGVTFGTITHIFPSGFRIESKSLFADGGDSGSFILTKTEPSKILGILALVGPCKDNPAQRCSIAFSAESFNKFTKTTWVLIKDNDNNGKCLQIHDIHSEYKLLSLYTSPENTRPDNCWDKCEQLEKIGDLSKCITAM